MSNTKNINVYYGKKNDTVFTLVTLFYLVLPVCVVVYFGAHWSAQVVTSLFGLLCAFGFAQSRINDTSKTFDNADDACDWLAAKFPKEGASE